MPTCRCGSWVGEPPRAHLQPPDLEPPDDEVVDQHQIRLPSTTCHERTTHPGSLPPPSTGRRPRLPCTRPRTSRRRRRPHRQADEEQVEKPLDGGRRRTDRHPWTTSSQIRHQLPPSRQPGADQELSYSPPPPPPSSNRAASSTYPSYLAIPRLEADSSHRRFDLPPPSAGDEADEKVESGEIAGGKTKSPSRSPFTVEGERERKVLLKN